MEVKSAAGKAAQEIDVSLKRTILHLGYVLRFRADVLNTGSREHAPPAPPNLIQPLRDEQARYNTLLDTIEKEIRFAQAVLERDLRKLEGRSPMPTGPATPSATTELAMKEDVTMLESSQPQAASSRPANIMPTPSPAPVPISTASTDAFLSSLSKPPFTDGLAPEANNFGSMAPLNPSDLDALMASITQPSSQSFVPPTSMASSTSQPNDFDQLLASFNNQDPQQLPNMNDFDVEKFLQSLGAGPS